MPGQSFRAYRSTHQEIPLRRYFLGVGAVLLALLFAVDWAMPRKAVESINSEPRLPKIRIHSELKGPETVVIDTSQPVPARTARENAAAGLSPPSPTSPHIDEIQLVSPSTKQAGAGEPNKAERKAQAAPRVVRARIKRLPQAYAQRPDPDPFDAPLTFGQQDPRIRDSFAQFVARPPKPAGARRKLAWARTEYARRTNFGWFDTRW